MKCCICNHEIEAKGTWTQGNNARPMANGRCCDMCNERHVIPSRLYARLAEQAGISGSYSELSVEDQDTFRSFIKV